MSKKRNQKKLAGWGFSGSYGTAGGGLAAVKKKQMQSGPTAYTKEEAASLAQTGRLGPTPTTTLFNTATSNSTPTQTTKDNAEVFDLPKSEISPSSPDAATNFDLDKFDILLSRLEASKGRQQRQRSVEGRKDIFLKGLASMMSKF
jgi:hypothetical protein